MRREILPRLLGEDTQFHPNGIGTNLNWRSA